MAEVNTGEGGGKKNGKVRSKKTSTKIDMTPMVDLAFLLITFFMLTTTLSKNYQVEIVMPHKDDHDPNQHMDLKASDALTLLLKKEKIVWYQLDKDGKLDKVDSTDYSDKGIRQLLIDKSQANSKLTVLIKPTDEAVYKNVIDMLDEIAIVKLNKYSMADITPDDLKVLAKKN